MNKIDFKKQNIPFTMVANGVLNDKKLSAGAKGLYAYLYSKPDGWSFASERIAEDMNCGPKAILTLINELKENGYLIAQRLASGRMIYTVIYPPEPHVEKGDEAQKATSPQRLSAKSHVAEKAVISNKELSNTDKEVIHTSDVPSQDVVETIEAFKSVNPTNYKKWFSNKTQRGAVIRLLAIHGKGRLLDIEAFLPKSNQIPYVPTITTPFVLEKKWSDLEAALLKIKNKVVSSRPNVIM